MDYGEKVGVKSTPTFFINGEIIAGAVPIENFSEVIDEALENAQK
jgi:protein-disulfide isomerase